MYFSHKGSDQLEKLSLARLDRTVQNVGKDPFENPSFKTQLNLSPAKLLAPSFLADHRNSHEKAPRGKGLKKYKKAGIIWPNPLICYSPFWPKRRSPKLTSHSKTTISLDL